MSEEIQKMFDDISGRYDMLNDILSFGTHRRWKKKIAIKAKEASLGGNGYYLDCATGTGDIASAILEVDTTANAVALDFSSKMISFAKKRHSKKAIDFHVQDISSIPYPDGTFDAATISFGIRNVDDPQQVISEMARCVKQDGKVIVLETGQPEGFIGVLYRSIYKSLLPLVGGVMAGNRSAYRYLPESAEKFPYGQTFANIMFSTDRFKDIQFQKLSFGVAYIYEGTVK